VDGAEAEHVVERLPPDPEFGLRGLHSLVQGPDGCMWFTQQTPPGLGRIDAHGDWRVWPLEPGMIPEDLSVGSAGRLYFNLTGRATVGSIQTGLASAETKAPIREGEAPPRLAKLAWAKTQAEPPGETKQPIVLTAPPRPASSSSSSSSSSSPSSTPPLPLPEPGRSRRLLEAMGFHFDYILNGRHLDRTDHILDRHSYNADPENSQFNPELSSSARIPELVLEGFRRAVETGRVLRRYDPFGMKHTPCEMGRPVGYYQRWDSAEGAYPWVATSWMDVVTRSWRMPDGSVRTVIWSAFPCSKGRF